MDVEDNNILFIIKDFLDLELKTFKQLKVFCSYSLNFPDFLEFRLHLYWPSDITGKKFSSDWTTIISNNKINSISNMGENVLLYDVGLFGTNEKKINAILTPSSKNSDFKKCKISKEKHEQIEKMMSKFNEKIINIGVNKIKKELNIFNLSVEKIQQISDVFCNEFKPEELLIVNKKIFFPPDEINQLNG